MALVELVAQLMQIPGARVGNGPKHPKSPDLSIESDIRAFLDEYPAVRRYSDYIDFLEMYAGAAIENQENTNLVDILGFSGVSMSMMELEGPVVSDGLLVFAICVYHRDSGKKLDTYEYDFAFSVSDDRRPGIYKCVSTLKTLNQPFSWYVDDFSSWLEEFIAKGGVYDLLRIPSPRLPKLF